MVLNFIINFVKKRLSKFTLIDDLQFKAESITFDAQDQLAIHFLKLLNTQGFFQIFFSISSFEDF